jgi:hypothetical protein
MTLIGDPDEVEGVESTRGMRLREGTSGYFRNFIVTGFKLVGIDVDVVDPSLSLDKGIVFGNLGGTGDAGAAPFITTLSTENPLIIDPFDTKYPDYRSVLFSHAYNNQNLETPPDNGFFDTTVTYLGGVDPFDDWTNGWTNTKVID